VNAASQAPQRILYNFEYRQSLEIESGVPYQVRARSVGVLHLVLLVPCPSYLENHGQHGALCSSAHPILPIVPSHPPSRGRRKSN
jgi:hypothetical protein